MRMDENVKYVSIVLTF